MLSRVLAVLLCATLGCLVVLIASQASPACPPAAHAKAAAPPPTPPASTPPTPVASASPPPPPPPACTRAGLAFVVAGFLREPSPVLALHLKSVVSFYGARASVFLVNNGDATSSALLAAALVSANVPAVRSAVIENLNATEYGYEWGALRAAARARNWSASCVPFEHVFVTQGNLALFAQLPEPFGTFKRVMWFPESWDNTFMRDWSMHALGLLGSALEARTSAGGSDNGLPLTPICQPTFGPNWVLSGACLEAWLQARALDIIRVNTKAKQCATERLTATIAAALCGAPCWDGDAGAFDGQIGEYPNKFQATSADPGNLIGRHWLKAWGTVGETANPCNRDRPYP